MGALFYVAYLAVGLVQIAAFMAGMELYFGIGAIISFIIFVVLYAVPFGVIAGSIMVYYGARYGWHWSVWQAIAIAAPGFILMAVVYFLAGTASLFGRRPA